VGPRAGLDDMEERKILALRGLPPLDRPARSQSLATALVDSNVVHALFYHSVYFLLSPCSKIIIIYIEVILLIPKILSRKLA
jgi:hypothetical protein